MLIANFSFFLIIFLSFISEFSRHILFIEQYVIFFFVLLNKDFIRQYQLLTSQFIILAFES